MHPKSTQLPLFPAPVLHATTGRPRSGQTFVCEYCARPFYRYQSDIRKATAKGSRMRYCSKACEFATRAEPNEERVCEACGIAFTIWPSHLRHAAQRGERAGRFCSVRCARLMQPGERRRGIDVACAACGAALRRTAATINDRNFCSTACMGTHVPRWTHGGRGINGIRRDLGHRCRSRWEANVCRVLVAMGVAYDYEPRVFRLGDVSYLPDLWVAGWSCWIEVKGWAMPAAMAKIAAFRAAYPDERLVIIDRAVYDAMEHEWAVRIPTWEHPVRKRTKVTPVPT